MKKKGFTLLEILIVIGIVAIIISMGSIAINRQNNRTALNRIRNEVGSFFYLASRRAVDQVDRGIGYSLYFDLDLNNHRIQMTDGQRGNAGMIIIDQLILPNQFEYAVRRGGGLNQDFESTMDVGGNILINFTLYVFNSNRIAEIQNNQEVVYAFSFTTDPHIGFLHIREYVPRNGQVLRASGIITAPANNPILTRVRE